MSRQKVSFSGVAGELAGSLNQRRIEVFGGTELAVVGNVRIRTENNCIPRDIAQVGDRLLFGYNITDEEILYRCEENRHGVYTRFFERPAAWGLEFTMRFGENT